MCTIVGAIVGVTLLALAATAGAHAWTPEAPTYGMGERANVTITASDGTELYGNLYYPTNSKTGAAALGRFPVLLEQTPYGKDDTAAPSYFVTRGYDFLITDVRGTGTSEGEWENLDPTEGRDGADWVRYAASLPNSDGKVGLIGESYLGMDQFETAAFAGSRHVKAMFPIVASNDLYRDLVFAGGFPDLEFDIPYMTELGALNTGLPFYEHNPDFATVLQQHIPDIWTYEGQTFANILLGGQDAYDESAWQERNPDQYIAQIVKDRIPAYLVGGWYDIFQRGEPLNYSFFQNAWDHRPIEAPMSPAQPVTPRYQLLMGPWYHSTAGNGLDYHGLDLNGLQLAWFDHWLKRIDTGITDTTTPLHLEDLATGAYHQYSRYPLNQATDTPYYLGAGGTLTTAKPKGTEAPDTLLFTGSEIPCDSSPDQWSAGEAAEFLTFFNLTDPCTKNDTLSQLGPGTQSFTTAPFKTATTLAGPIGASLYASTTTSDAEWVVQISDVAPNGTSTELTSGLLEGNQRAIDQAQTWYAPDGNPILPYHPYTQAAKEAITPGKVTRFDIEIFPTDDTLEPGHRLRVTIATSDWPHAMPDAAQGPNLLGGIYELEHDAADPSTIELPLIIPHPATRRARGCRPKRGRHRGRRRIPSTARAWDAKCPDR